MSDTTSLPTLIAVAPRDLAAWVHWLREAPVPVLSHTAAEIQALAQLEDDKGCVDAQTVVQAVSDDPLMTVKVLAYAGQHRSRQQVTDAETLTAAIMLMGIGPFFSTFTDLPVVENRLADHPLALAGLHDVLRRARRAGQFALGFANHRMDGDAAAVHTAATLHDFAEMLLWCHAPVLALDIAARQAVDPTLRSTAAQQAVLNTTLTEIEQSLMKVWRLPEILMQLTDDSERHALVAPQRRIVQLAVRVARHTTHGWDNPAMPDDLQDVADLLNLSISATQRLLRDLDS